MNTIKNLSKKSIITIIICIVIAATIVGVIFLINYLNMPRGTITYINDPSGLTVYSTNAEYEESADQHPIVIGFDIFFKFGFSSIQQEAIYDTVQSFFAINYPSFARVSYIKDSFKYVPSDSGYNKSTFLVMSDTGQQFEFSLDTNNSYDDITISIPEL